MLINLTNIINNHNLDLRGVIHVGAHRMEELDQYQKFLDNENIFWVEALNKVVSELRRQHPEANIYNEVIDEEETEQQFNVANNEQSSSLLSFGTHSKLFPSIRHHDTESVITMRMDTLIEKNNIPIESINMLNTDCQGNDLSVIKSLGKYIDNFTAIYCGIYAGNVYDNNPLIEEMDEYLQSVGFYRAETKFWGSDDWGDALYLRRGA